MAGRARAVRDFNQWRIHSNPRYDLEGAANEPLHGDLRYQGQLFDVETGLHYNRHRYYDPDMGQY
jgi:RHS repeat-associated protein